MRWIDIKEKWSKKAWEDYNYWRKYDKKIFKKINELIKSISESPFSGLGKPEPLKYDYSGFWSRKIDESNRLIYSVEEDCINILQCKNHYKDK